MEYKKQSYSPGFTIVELLIVIVVIGILAAITIVAYNGIQGRAVAATLTSDLDNASKKLKLYQVDNSGYPTSIDCSGSPVANSICLKSSNGITYTTFTPVNTTNPQTFCITATNGTTNYFINQDGTPTSGGCAITNLATNPSAEVDIGWYSNNGAVYPRSWDNTLKRSGNRSIVSWNLGDSATLMSLYAIGGSTGNGFPIVGGKTFTSSIYFRAEVPNQGRLIVTYRLNGVWSGAVYGAYTTGTTDSWTRASQTFDIPADADMLRLSVHVIAFSVSPAGTKAWVDDIIVTEGTGVMNYSDGSTPNWIWNGSSDASTSTGSPL